MLYSCCLEAKALQKKGILVEVNPRGSSWVLQNSVIRFAPASRNAASADGEQLDKAGQTILQLLNKAADTAEQKADRP